MKKTPIAVACLAWLLIAVGVLVTAAHLSQWRVHTLRADEFFWICVVGLAAVVAGVFLLRGRGWARWLALAWMAFHVVLSVFHPRTELIVHSAFLVLFAYFLFNARARAFFQAGQTGSA